MLPAASPDERSADIRRENNRSISKEPTALRSKSVPDRSPDVRISADRKGSETTREPLENEKSPRARSSFFGAAELVKEGESAKPQLPKTESIRELVTKEARGSNELILPVTKAARTIRLPFGTMLPVRILGTILSLKGSGGLVRMELTRSFSIDDKSLPAGMIVVGRIRGSERDRVFITTIGLIDPESGGLVKFEGEAIGTDGASGLSGKIRQVRGLWSKIFGGLREAGATAIGAVGNRGGGTVVISDSSARAAGMMTDELSGMVGNAKSSDRFVEIAAGTNGFILITGLPNEENRQLPTVIFDSPGTPGNRENNPEGILENE